ncbi:MAG TPA: DNA polymerase III subunit delta' [Pyrinomonadaceae bacterium]|nr:DNA polymerase III subunit delta' [Pyrinomonadaceae bacterium]
MFDRLVGNQRAQATLRRMLEQRRVPGALLFAGEEAVGKKLFALELAKALNCLSPVGIEACDKCSSCVRITHFADAQADKSDDAKHIIWSEHRDVGLVKADKRVINVQQVRDVELETNFRPHEGKARVFIIEDADKMNAHAANALLKTLEEPAPTSHLILVTTRPANLLTTIRSRCQTIRFAPLTSEEIENFLVRHQRRAGEEARLAAHLSRGRLGLALSLNLDAYRESREAMLSILDALVAVQADRVRLLRAAEDLSDAKRKDEFEPRLDVLETLIRDAWLLSLDPAAKIVNEDIRARLARLGAGLKSRHAADWMARIQELRGQLAVNINRRVATDALLLSMAATTTK